MNDEDHTAIIERVGAVMQARRERGEVTSEQFSDEYYKMIRAEIAAAKAADEEPEAVAAPRSGDVVPMLRPTTQVKPAPKPIIAKRDAALHINIGSSVISVMQGHGEDILLTEKAGWHYIDGIWTVTPDRLTYLLDGQIEKAIRGLNYESKTKLVNEVR
jgi:hypothetical protein